MNEVLIVSNDPVLKQKLIDALAQSDFHTDDVSDGLDGLLMVDKNGFDIIIIDEELSDIESYRACQKIRQYSDIPIILLGTEQPEKVWAKVDDLGFDTYLKKPVSPRELVSHIKAILRRTHPGEKVKPLEVEAEGPPEIEATPVIPLQEMGTGQLTETAEEEKPAEIETTPVTPLQENGTAQLTETVEEEKPAEIKATQVIPLQENGTAQLAETVEEEKPAEVQEQKNMCPDCGLENPPRQQFCGSCGAKLSLEEQAVQVTPSQEAEQIQLEETVEPEAVPSQPEAEEAPADEQPAFKMWQDARVAKLIEALMIGKLAEINPVIDISLKSGFSYPEIDGLLETSGEETRHILEELANENLLDRKPFEKLRVDPEGSFQLVPVERCPHCDSGNLTRGQLIEHFYCGHVGLDEDFKSELRYICPKCKRELKLIGTDYRSPGMRYRCLDCNEIFPTPVTKWRNLTTGRIWSDEQVRDVWLSSYTLSVDKKDWLDFQLHPKAQLIDFLKLQGYQVEELAQIHGKSGATHTLDILATMDDGLVQLSVGIGILSALPGEAEVGLEELFKFDTRAYDMGINHKVVITMPKLNSEALKFAERQRITVFQAKDLGAFISILSSRPRKTAVSDEMELAPGTALSPEAKIMRFLKHQRYDVIQKAQITGRSGTDHIFDIFAQRDDGIVIPTIAIEVTIADKGQAIGIDEVLQFDSKAYDTGIRNKVLVAIPEISPQARQLATQQRIRIIENKDLENLQSSSS